MDFNSVILNKEIVHVPTSIFKLLDDDTLISCVFVCKTWRRFIYDSDFWVNRWLSKLSYSMKILQKKRGIPGPPTKFWQNIIRRGVQEDKPLFKNFVMQVAHLSQQPSRYLASGHLIFSAIKTNNVKLVHTMIQNKDDQDLDFRYNRELRTVLHFACNYGKPKMIKLFLESLDETGLNVNHNAVPHTNTPLHVLSRKLQIYHNNIEALEFMLDNSQKFGINIHAKNLYFRSPFQEFCHFAGYNHDLTLRVLDVWVKYPVEFNYSTLQMLGKATLICIIKRSYTELMNDNNAYKLRDFIALSYGSSFARGLLKIDFDEKFKNVNEDRIVQIAREIIEEKRISIVDSDPSFQSLSFQNFKALMSESSRLKCNDFGVNNLWFCDICDKLFAYEGLFMIHFREDHQD